MSRRCLRASVGVAGGLATPLVGSWSSLLPEWVSSESESLVDFAWSSSTAASCALFVVAVLAGRTFAGDDPGILLSPTEVVRSALVERGLGGLSVVVVVGGGGTRLTVRRVGGELTPAGFLVAADLRWVGLAASCELTVVGRAPWLRTARGE